MLRQIKRTGMHVWIGKLEKSNVIALFAGAHFLFVQDPRGIGVNSAGGWDGGYVSRVNLRVPNNHGFSL